MKTDTNSLYDAMKAAGVPIENHATDLYVPVNPITTAIIQDYDGAASVTRFRSQIDGKMWFDIPFAYRPAWEAMQR